MPVATNISQERNSPRTLGVFSRQELAGLLGEVEQDGVAVEHGGVAVDDRRRLAVGVDRPERRLVLLALAGVDGDELVGEARLLEKQRHLRGVRATGGSRT